MTDLEKTIYEQVLAGRGEIVALRRELHRCPELSGEEFETQRIIERELDRLGLPHFRVVGTGMIAELSGTARSDAPRCIALRADIDGLPVEEESGAPYASRNPGRMHACGHDAHTAALLGAARVLSAKRDLFAGKVIFVFQPGEETGYGGRPIVEGGFIDEAQRSFGLHLASEVPVGTVVVMAGPNNAAVDWFRLRVHGRSAHVSTPEKGVDALYIASQIVVGAQAIAARQTNPMENVIVGIGKLSSGSAYNVVAQEAVLEGTIRTLTPELRRATKAKLEALAQHTAASFGGTVEFEWNDNTAPLINDAEASREAQKTAVSLFGAEHVITQRRPALGGDDFAEFVLRVPGVYAYIGSGNPTLPNTVAAHHNSHFDIDEDCLAVSTALTCCYAVEYLNGLV